MSGRLTHVSYATLYRHPFSSFVPITGGGIRLSWEGVLYAKVPLD